MFSPFFCKFTIIYLKMTELLSFDGRNEFNNVSFVGKQLSLWGNPTIKQNTNKEHNQKTLSVVSLFSGCGGLDLGFLGNFKFRHLNFPANKFKVVFSNDIDVAATKVYNSNQKYFNHTITLADVKSIAEKDIPDFDILLAGFPCQPFSNAGQRKGVNDDRGTLFQECERFIKVGLSRKCKPKAFVFENVRGIMSSKMPDGTTVPEEIKKLTEKLGFNTTYKLIKASDYGVPSDRYRLVIIGVHKDLGAFDFNLLDDIVAEFNLPNAHTSPYELYLGSILSDIPKNAPQRDDYWKYSPSGQYMIEKIGYCKDGKEVLKKFVKKISLEEISKTIKKGRSWKNMNPEDMSERFRKIWDDPKKYHAPNFYRRFALGEINGTITASAQPENCGITHPFEHRRFTIREIARIQSFPDDFEFPYTTIANAYKVIGNAVPPIMGWVIARALQEFLYDKLPQI
jgi:DNA (cytosine-5)-methyltransferase 1